MTSAADIEALIRQLSELKVELSGYNEIELLFVLNRED
jgi:hypothetical protein